MCARVLVVDDDPVNADLLGYLLRAFGHDAALTLSGAEALRDADARLPDLVLCDIQMPGIDGYEVLRRLRADRRFDGTQIVGVTALAMVGDREKVLAAGFDGYMAKPITPETFVEEIEKYLPEGAASGAVANCPLPVVRDLPATGNWQPTTGYALVVDDQEPNVELMRHLLTSLGAEVRTAHNAADALHLARVARPKLVISDLHMPGQTGLELLEAMKADPALRDVPFLLISASAASGDEQKRALAAGAAAKLLRPIDPEALLEVLTRFMRAESAV
jgi:two-component system cell cycle response regulator